MPDRRRRVLAFAVVVATCFAPATPSRAAGSSNLPSGCVARLTNRATGSGAKAYLSRYVTDGTYAYGEWRTGSFGGQSLWTKRDGGWCKTETGLATLDRAAIIGYGVPARNAGRLLAKMHAAGDLAPPVAASAMLGVHAHRSAHRR